MEALNEDAEDLKSDKSVTPPTDHTTPRNTNIGLPQLLITDSPQLRAPPSPNYEFLVQLHKGNREFGFKIRKDHSDNQSTKCYIFTIICLV